MSNHRGPEGVPPDDQRCEALAKGSGKALYWEWTRHDRRCARRANQTREGFSVCYIHGATKEVVKWVGK